MLAMGPAAVVNITINLGYCPHQPQSILGVLLRAIYSHIVSIIQLLLRGGSTQPKPLNPKPLNPKPCDNLCPSRLALEYAPKSCLDASVE